MSDQAVPIAPSLLSLPNEVLTTIALLLDRPSAQSLRLTSQRINACCEQRLWQNLDLSLQPHFGDLPLIIPEGGAKDICAWEEAEEKRSEGRRAVAIRDKVKAVMNAANRRRWGMVEKLQLELRPGATNAFIQLLDNLPNLKTLDIESAGSAEYYSEVRAPAYESLDVRMIESGLQFSQLTHVSIGRSGIYYLQFIPLICNMALSLVSLSVDFTGDLFIPSELEEPEWRPSRPTFPEFEGETGILQLHLTCPPFTENDDRFDHTITIANILKHTPRVQIFFLDCIDIPDEIDGVTSSILKLVDLREFTWTVTARSFWTSVSAVAVPGKEYCPKLEMLELAHGIWHDVFTNRHTFSALREISYGRLWSRSLRQAGPTSLPETGSAESMTPDFAHFLRLCPRLRSIHSTASVDPEKFEILGHIDRIEESIAANGSIRSMRHSGSSELLHARFFHRWTEISDSASPPDGWYTRDSTVFRYRVQAGQRIKRFKKCKAASWHNYTDYGGRVVPIRIITRMREVENASEGDWEGRGIEVGAAAWKVLMDWKEAEVMNWVEGEVAMSQG